MACDSRTRNIAANRTPRQPGAGAGAARSSSSSSRQAERGEKRSGMLLWPLFTLLLLASTSRLASSTSSQPHAGWLP